MLARKKWDDELAKLTKAVETATALVRKITRFPNKETEPKTSQRIMGGSGSRAQQGPSL